MSPPELPWLEWEVGERVSLLHRGPDGLHEALGTLLEVSPHHVVISTRRGPEKVEATAMVTGRRVPPPRMRA